MEQMSDDLLNKLSFSICDLKTVIYFLKTTNVIKEFSQCVLLCDQIQKSMSNYDNTVESTSNLLTPHFRKGSAMHTGWPQRG